jgi:hypothetical protein
LLEQTYRDQEFAYPAVCVDTAQDVLAWSGNNNLATDNAVFPVAFLASMYGSFGGTGVEVRRYNPEQAGFPANYLLP